MAEPFCLRPDEIDAMTFAQVSLYYEDDDEDVAYEDVLAHVEKYRREHGIPGPDDLPVVLLN